MNFNFSKRVRDGILYIETEGKGPSLADVKKFSKDVFEFCLKNNCTRILADDRNQSYSLTDLELFELGEFHASSMPALIKFAVVCTSDAVGKIKLWENTAYNRGRNVKIFMDLQLAEQWLKE